VVLAVSAVGSERGTVADSVLSRGISRHQYFLAKWHARLVVVTATFAVLACAVLMRFPSKSPSTFCRLPNCRFARSFRSDAWFRLPFLFLSS